MAFDFSSFFSQSGGTSGGTGKSGGAGYSSDVQDSGKTSTGTNVVVGGIGTTTAAQSGGAPMATAQPASMMVWVAIIALGVLMVVRR